MKEIPVFKPLLGKKEIDAATEALENGWLGMGRYVGDFEKAVESLLDQSQSKYALAVSTGHAALHLALMDLDIKPGDEVITPSFNNIADFQAILAVGGKPVFCDIDESSLCADVDSVKRLISKKTKAIIIMDYSCQLCDYDAFIKLRKETGIPIIHDAAHSFGCEYNHKMLGGIFDYTMFSFDPVKSITCIDGGILLVHEMDAILRLRERRLVGMGQPSDVMYQNRRAWTYDVRMLGFRYHMANLHAAIGLAQLSQIENIRKTRLKTFKKYMKAFEKGSCIKSPHIISMSSMPFSFYLRILNNKRTLFIEFMKSKGVDIGIHWQPGHVFSLFKDCKKDVLEVTELITDEIVSIPFHSNMSEDDENYVIDTVMEFDKKYG